FVLLSCHLKKNILAIWPSWQPPTETPPILPDETILFLQNVCDMPYEFVEGLWKAVKDVVWKQDPMLECVKDDNAVQQTFKKKGGRLYRDLWPPTTVCINPRCKYVTANKKIKLQGLVEHEGVLYTKERGAIPIRTNQITCEGCRVVYHHDYYITTNSETKERKRFYYKSYEDEKPLPNVLQVSTHHFVEVSLVTMWRFTMLFSWTSATSCIETYTACDTYGNVSAEWSIKPLLRVEYVYDSFKILSLLEFHHSQGSQLRVPQAMDQVHRFDIAMQEVNEFIRVHSQPEIGHRCDKCVRNFFKDGKEEMEVFAVVCDGVTVGRPTCGVAHCKGQLSSTKVSFCEAHSSKERQCRINGCEAQATPGSKSCADVDHKAVERCYNEVGQSTFLLKQRSERAHQAFKETNDVWDAEVDLDTGSGLMFDVVHQGKKKNIRAQFGRKRTHNEQLIICPCGIIVARETFFHSEAFSLVASFCKETFQHRRKPNHFIYDTNCILSKHVRNHTDPEMRQFFKDIGLAVDVFHFKSKHKESDTYCGQNCNPFDFPELLYTDENGRTKWYFNTSIAEQTNTWFSRYQPMCREMGSIFYDFFLNQMVLMHNVHKKNQLTREGFNPRYW
ncbi:hypothetical protein K435DRAFT_606423, partial [Dendrothele bispora CBS 962.96]